MFKRFLPNSKWKKPSIPNIVPPNDDRPTQGGRRQMFCNFQRFPSSRFSSNWNHPIFILFFCLRGRCRKSGITQSLCLLLPINMGIKSGSEKIISVSTHACMPSWCRLKHKLITGSIRVHPTVHPHQKKCILLFSFPLQPTFSFFRRKNYDVRRMAPWTSKTEILKNCFSSSNVPPIPNYQPCQMARFTSHYNNLRF